MSDGLTIRNFADAVGGVFYNGGVPYDATGALLIDRAVVSAETDPVTGGITGYTASGGILNDRMSLPGAVPAGMDWMTDTLHGFDIYNKGLVKTPTLFFDPTATSSAGRGTYRNPYTTQAELMAAIAGDMSGHVVGFKRGTTLRVTGANGLQLVLHGSVDDPVILCPYGDAEALPIISGGAVITSWALVDAGSNIWSYSLATESDCWQYDSRLWKKTWSANAINTLTAEGTSTFNSSTLYIRPFNGENPNQGQMTICVSDYALQLIYSDVPATGYIKVVGLDLQYTKHTALTIGVDSAASITTIDDICITGCRVVKSGVDKSGGSYVGNGITFYGANDTKRVTNGFIAGNYISDVLNNTIEVSGNNGTVIEHNYGESCGGNSIVEAWSSNSNLTIRYNKGNFSSTKGRIYTNYAQSGIMLANFYHNGTDWESAGSDATHAKNTGNVAHHNLIINAKTRAIKLSGGSGHKIAHNTAFFDSDLLHGAGTTTGPQGWYTEGDAASGFADISNNLFYWKNTTEAHRYPNLMRINSAVGANASVPSGNKNIYFTAWSMSDGTFYATDAGFEGAGDDSTDNFTNYKTALAAYSLDQNSFTSSNKTGGTLTSASLNFNEETYAVGVGSAALAAGLTTLTGIGSRYYDGVPYVAGTCSIGALLGG